MRNAWKRFAGRWWPSERKHEARFLTEAQEARRPKLRYVPRDGSSRHAPLEVLAVGICLADRENTARDVQARLAEARQFRVEQRWVSVRAEVGSKQPGVRRPFLKTGALRPKYEFLNEIIDKSDLGRFSYLMILDDDIALPIGFVDAFLDLQSRLDFAIAQPARTTGSFIDLPIVEEHPGLIARRTLFVEQGPVISFRRDIFESVLPFDLRSPMGWGYENIWSLRLDARGRRLGIIDATPVDHGIRRPVTGYSWENADRGRTALLAAVEHRPTSDCFRVIEPFATIPEEAP